MSDLRAKLADGRPLFGSWVAIAGTIAAELMGSAGYDFLIVDTQHGGVSADALLPILQAIDVTGTPALVRVDWLDPARIMRAADLGAAGVIVPMVSTPEEARIAARAIRYPPDGMRSFGPVRSHYDASGVVADPLCLVMVETAQALDHLDAIAATPGVDGILVGPVDLALSLELGPALVMPDVVLAAIDRVVAACEQHGKIAASVGLGLPNAREQVRRGVRMMAVASDSLFIRRGAAEDLEQMRRWGDA